MLLLLFLLFLNVKGNEETKRILADFDQWKTNRNQFMKLSREYPFGWKEFRCSSPEEIAPAEDVHSLAPWNINVVAALGDSLTAGRAASAEDFSEILKDFPEISFATGKDGTLRNRTTLHHIFNVFNSNLAGRKRLFNPGDDFNFAVSGSFSSALLQQAKELVKRLNSSRDVDMGLDWKFINVFIGSNDLCKFCLNESEFGVESFERNIRSSLLFLKENLPRSFVNLMNPFSVHILYETHDQPFCVDFHRISCPCLFSMNKTEFSEKKKEFDDRLERIAKEEIFRDDFFAVSLAPVISKIETLPIIGSLPNLAFLSLDCFHFSEMAHDMVAKLVWRSLFEPLGNRIRLTSFDDFNPFLWECPPNECPFLQTWKNSNSCSMAKVRYPSLSGISVKVNNPSLPSMSELEARAWAEENSLFLLFLFIGIIFLLLVAVFLCFSFRKRQLRRQMTEETPLLLTANLYDDVF